MKNFYLILSVVYLKIIFILLTFLFTDCKTQTREMAVPEMGIQTKVGQIYNAPGVKRIAGSETEILEKLNLLVEWTVKKDYSRLPEIVHPEKGIYVDLKSHWDYTKLQNELKNPDSYLEVFFLNQDKLNKEKEGINYTVRNLLILGKEISFELYFESKDACEVKVKFSENETKANDLNNPYLIRVDGKWYIHRLFQSL